MPYQLSCLVGITRQILTKWELLFYTAYPAGKLPNTSDLQREEEADIRAGSMLTGLLHQSVVVETSVCDVFWGTGPSF